MPGNPLVRFDEGRVGRTARCRPLSYSTRFSDLIHCGRQSTWRSSVLLKLRSRGALERRPTALTGDCDGSILRPRAWWGGPSACAGHSAPPSAATFGVGSNLRSHDEGILSDRILTRG